MTRPTRVYIDTHALIHNIHRIRQFAPKQKIIAMVKANAYGCGLTRVLPALEGQVDAFGVACIEEAIALRKWGSRTPCILFQGVFSQDELDTVDALNLGLVIHTHHQLEWFLAHTFKNPIPVWVKVNTGMHRLGFEPAALTSVLEQLVASSSVEKPIGVMSHFASADDPSSPQNLTQFDRFEKLTEAFPTVKRSLANSAAIMALPHTHLDWVRPGIMLYGVSPFYDKSAQDLGLKPVMHFYSSLLTLNHYKAHAPIGYGATWKSDKPSVIGVVPVGYGDGYPRHLYDTAYVYINHQRAPVVGRVSMDMITVDLTDIAGAEIGMPVELWGAHISIEEVAKSAQTIPYELLCQITPRARDAQS